MIAVQQRALVRLLVVDDSELVHRSFRRVFREEDHGFHEVQVQSAFGCADAAAAVRAAHAAGERFDVAFVDLEMPEGPDGFETTRTLRAIDPELPVVLCTAHVELDAATVGRELGDQQLLVLTKPFHPIEVRQAVASFARLRADWDVRQEALRAESMRRERVEVELRHAQKLEAIGALAAGIAHEINTPIQFVGDSLHFVREGFADVLRLLDACRERLPPERRAELRALEEEVDLDFVRTESPEAFAMCVDGIERVARIVKGLKAFSHHGDERGPADLNLAIQHAVTVARHAWKTVALVDLELEDVPQVHCAIGDVNQVLLNLIVNAAHAIEDRVGSSGDLGRIRITSRQVDDDVVISVGDTGAGIPEEIRDRIFEPFFTTKAVGRGTGQGLAITYALIVEGHGGRVHFDTGPEGTTFHLHLPIRGAS